MSSLWSSKNDDQIQIEAFEEKKLRSKAREEERGSSSLIALHSTRRKSTKNVGKIKIYVHKKPRIWEMLDSRINLTTNQNH